MNYEKFEAALHHAFLKAYDEFEKEVFEMSDFELLYVPKDAP